MSSAMKVIWAIDPYGAANAKIKAQAVNLLRELSRGSRIEILPVYVMTPEQVNVPTMMFSSQERVLAEEAKTAAARLLKGVSLAGLRAPEVLVRPIVMMRGAVKALDSYAHEIGASLIVVGAHGRKGVSRLFLGSFAETLLLLASTPTVIVGRQGHVPKGSAHVLFPTDLGVKAGHDLERVAALAKQRHAKLTIMHVVQRPTILSTGSQALITEDVVVRETEKAARAKAEALARKAQRLGVRSVSVEVKVSGQGVADEILTAARAGHAQLIVMAPQSGWATASLIGSTARQVVRAAEVPVWILHEEAEAAVHRKRKAA